MIVRYFLSSVVSHLRQAVCFNLRSDNWPRDKTLTVSVNRLILNFVSKYFRTLQPDNSSCYCKNSVSSNLIGSFDTLFYLVSDN